MVSEKIHLVAEVNHAYNCKMMTVGFLVIRKHFFLRDLAKQLFASCMRAHCRSKFTVPAQQYTLRASHALSSALECDVCHERCHLLTTSPTFADDSPLHILDKFGCLGLHVHDRPS